ncbi:ARM REPEAT PROTEIN INTERACTING WITH ABF2 isoform X1 [Oryza glaberrima]|uniref:ARM REPEAT PROTEIN INTERACTING WITH ABF2 isoform X1 n=1 Tax=Oryza glaberrima TaxID=4538 RepID=UPI00224C4375|nr:ARM REPEAT PROTEIN INTERACTING WITH ABF2 isoform X1 [Oryza glaberrima]
MVISVSLIAAAAAAGGGAAILLGALAIGVASRRGRAAAAGGGGEGEERIGDHEVRCCSFDRGMSLHCCPAAGDPPAPAGTAEELLERARSLVPAALDAARAATGFGGRWKAIAARLERVPPCLSDLSSHPCFSKNSLCRELLQSVAATLAEAAELGARCREPPRAGKLQMQSDLDALAGKLDLNLRDCALLIKTGVLSDATVPPVAPAAEAAAAGAAQTDVRELLARLQIGHAEAKHRAVDGLLDALREDEKSVLSALGRGNVAALVQLLTATAPKIREKAATVLCLLAESGSCECLLVSEGALPPLIRLVESGSLVGREKAVITLQRLSMSPDIARAIVGHSGVRPLIDICQTGDSISQSAAAGALKNLSAVPEVRQALAEEGIVRVMVNLLDCGVVLGCKEYAAECLQSLTSSNDGLRRAVVSEGGLRSLLAYLDGPLPQESAVGALRNLVSSAISPDSLVSLGVLPRLVHVLREGSVGAQQAAAAAICRVSSSSEMKRLVGEHGCMPLLVRLLEAKSNGAREVAAQAVASLMSCPANARDIKKDEKSVPNLVQLLEPSPQNTAKKYAISCLLTLSASKRCKKLMISHGAIGYLKKLSEMDVAGAKKLLEKLERGKLRNLFSRK